MARLDPKIVGMTMSIQYMYIGLFILFLQVFFEEEENCPNFYDYYYKLFLVLAISTFLNWTVANYGAATILWFKKQKNCK